MAEAFLQQVLLTGCAAAVIVAMIKPLVPKFAWRAWVLRFAALVIGAGLGAWLGLYSDHGWLYGLAYGTVGGGLSTTVYQKVREFIRPAAEPPEDMRG